MANQAPTDYGQLIKDAWSRAIKSENIVPLLVGILIVGVGGGLTIGILAGPLMLGYTTILLKVARGERADLGDLKTGFDRFGTSLITLLLAGIAIAVGCIVVVGGVVLAFMFSFAFFVMATRPELGAVDILKESWRLVRQSLSDVLVVWVIGAVLNAVLSPTGIGVIAGSAFTSLLLALVFIKTAPAAAAAQPADQKAGAASAF